MNDLEKMVWAAAYAAEFAYWRELYMGGNGHKSVDDISGYDCADIADAAVEKLREAMAGPGSEYLLPVWDDRAAKGE